MPVYTSRARVAAMLLMLLIPLILLMTACGEATTARRADAPPTATALPDLLNCAPPLPIELRGAQPVVILDTNFPDSGVALATITSPDSALMQVVEYIACMQVFDKGSVGNGNISAPVVSDTSSPAAEVVDALGLINRGWLAAPAFPFNGADFLLCKTDQLCYTVGEQRYLELEQISDRSHGVLTFVLRMASPQPLVSCDPALFPVDFYPRSTSVLANAEFPLPPHTKVSSGYGNGIGILTYFCTDGTPDSIQAFMEKRLPLAGWSSLTVGGARLWKFRSGTGPVYMRILPITDPHRWSIQTYYSDANLG